jgi:energy-coupling factor transporter transmembrane protein EcfT
LLAALVGASAALLLHPSVLSPLLRWRWAALAFVLIVPNLLWLGEPDVRLLGVPLSTSGFHVGLHMALRALVILLAVIGFSRAVDIAEVAGLLERVGLRGLGFSMGVAVNLLPSLQGSSQHAWQALRMRGGLRHARWRGLRMLAVTVIANALKRAEDLALAAEVRAFDPARARPLPLRQGAWDHALLLAAGAAWVAMILAL